MTSKTVSIRLIAALALGALLGCTRNDDAGVVANVCVVGSGQCAAQAQVAAGDHERDDGAAHAPGGAEHGDVQHGWIIPRGS